MSFNYYESLDKVSRARYDAKLNLIGLNECPYKLPEGIWENNPLKWPKLQLGNVFTYILKTPVDCKNHGWMARKISFYAFPSEKDRRERWIAAVKRINPDGSRWEPGKYAVLCSDHFIQGKPNGDPCHPDYIPSVFHHARSSEKENTNKLQRFASAVKRKITFNTPTPAKRSRKALSPLPENEIYTATPLDMNSQSHEIGFQKPVCINERLQFNKEISNLREDVEKLKSVKATLEKVLHASRLSYENVEGDDLKCKFYTGTSSYIFIDRPKQLKARAKCYSNYKKHSTVKILFHALQMVLYHFCHYVGEVECPMLN